MQIKLVVVDVLLKGSKFQVLTFLGKKTISCTEVGLKKCGIKSYKEETPCRKIS